MNTTIIRIALAALLVLGFTAISNAQTPDINGTVQRVDVSNSTVYLTDGRAVRLAPGTRLYVGGRQVALGDVQPGWVFVTSGAPATTAITPALPVITGGVATPSSAAPVFVTTTPTSSMAPSAPRVDATGIVANVEPATGTITLQDGRVIGIAPGTTVWLPVTVGSVVPGASVFIRNAQPLDFQPGAALPAARPMQMGTVSSVDASNARVVLSDGTVVHLRPGSQLMFNGQSLAVSDLRPGDEVVVGVPSGSTVAMTSTAPGVSALPRQAVAGVLEGEYLYVVRRPESP